MHLFPQGQRSIGPDELEMLHQTLRAWCEECHCELKSPEALEAARELVTWFDYGITERRQLRELIQPL
jgi:hypothetical protein